MSSLIPGGRTPRLRHTHPSGHLDYVHPFDPRSIRIRGPTRAGCDAAAPTAADDVYPGRTSDGRRSLAIVSDGNVGRRWKLADPA